MSWINPFTTKRKDVHPSSQIDYDFSVLMVLYAVIFVGMFVAIAVWGVSW